MTGELVRVEHRERRVCGLIVSSSPFEQLLTVPDINEWYKRLNRPSPLWWDSGRGTPRFGTVHVGIPIARRFIRL